MSDAATSWCTECSRPQVSNQHGCTCSKPLTVELSTLAAGELFTPLPDEDGPYIVMAQEEETAHASKVADSGNKSAEDPTTAKAWGML